MHREIIVTGMHRSGTSAIANLIHRMGVSVGPYSQLIPGSRENQKGFFENLDVVSFNEQILRRADSSWDSPDVQKILQYCTTISVQQDTRKLLEKFRSHECSFLLKDPRFSLTLPAWIKELHSPIIVCCTRIPIEIAQSLQKRNGFSIFKGLGLWEIYLRNLAIIAKEHDCIFVNFNELLSQPEICSEKLRISLAQKGVVLENDSSDAASSIEKDLQYQKSSTERLGSLLSANQLDLWNALQQEDFSHVSPFDTSSADCVSEFLQQKDTNTGYANTEDNVQLFIDAGNGFSESQSTVLPCFEKNATYTFRILEKDILKYRLDPLARRCIIKKIDITATIKGKVYKIENFSHNGEKDTKTGFIFFQDNESAITFNTQKKGATTISVYLEFLSLNPAIIDSTLASFLSEKYTLNKEKQKQSIAQIQQIKNELSLSETSKEELKKRKKDLENQHSNLQNQFYILQGENIAVKEQSTFISDQLTSISEKSTFMSDQLTSISEKSTFMSDQLTSTHNQYLSTFKKLELICKELTLNSRKNCTSLGIRSILILAKFVCEPKNFILSCLHYNFCRKEDTFFSKNFYLDLYPDVLLSALTPLQHFLFYGWKEGRKPSKYFDTEYYLTQYPDVAKTGINPLLHYIQKGWSEGRNPSSSFCTSEYLAVHPEIFKSRIHPLVYFHKNKEKVTTKEGPSTKIIFGDYSCKFQKKICVIIPTYLSSKGSVGIFRKLISSLIQSYPRTNPFLQLIVIDDKSPIAEVQTVLQEYNLLHREDFTFLQNKINKGFVKTVNLGLEDCDKSADIVILNCDTEIHGKVFERLQSLCYRHEKTASVTPLSNRATIACIDNWPMGTDNLYDCSPEEIANCVHACQLISPDNHIPTGHGFCMYMTRQALSDVGNFDADNFGQGYGEENDWSIRAIRKGYNHLISTETYVHHHETMSFTNEQKTSLKEKNYKKLLEKHPFYDAMVQHYLKKNPLKNHRNILKMLVLEKNKKTKKMNTICFFLHDNFRNHFGGVQKHIHDFYQAVKDSEKVEFIIVSPVSFRSEIFNIQLLHEKERLIVENIDESTTISILEKLGNRIDFLHVHHAIDIKLSFKKWVKKLQAKSKVFTFHDFDLFCSNPCLLNNNGDFCLGEKEKCNMSTCEKESDIRNNYLSCFDKLYTPSSNTKKHIEELCEKKEITEKIEVLSHFLPFADKLEETEEIVLCNKNSKNIVFLGALCKHKGGDLFLATCKQLADSDFRPIIFGITDPVLWNNYPANKPPVLPYKNWFELLLLQKRIGVHIVILPTIWAETFSYTFYEALLLLKVPVIVGSYGHPADVVKQWGVGEILHNNTPSDIISTVQKISNNYEEYSNRVITFSRENIHKFREEKYITKYWKEVLGEKLQRREEVPITPKKTLSFYSQDSVTIENNALTSDLSQKLRICLYSEKEKTNFTQCRYDNYYDSLSFLGNDVVEKNPAGFLPDVTSFDIILFIRTLSGNTTKYLLSEAKQHGIPVALDINGLSPLLENSIQEKQKNIDQIDFFINNTNSHFPFPTNKPILYFENIAWVRHIQLYKNLFESRPQFKEKRIGFVINEISDIDGSTNYHFFKNYSDSVDDCELVLIRRPEKETTCTSCNDYESYLQELQKCRVITNNLPLKSDIDEEEIILTYFEAGLIGTPIISKSFPMLSSILEQDITGWLGETEEDWEYALDIALSNSYFKYIGENCHQYIMQYYTDRVERINRLLHGIITFHNRKNNYSGS